VAPTSLGVVTSATISPNRAPPTIHEAGDSRRIAAIPKPNANPVTVATQVKTSL
jgi:hypothetical protein